jgi:hypothetical protein
MTAPFNPIQLADLTAANIAGAGVFDVLMRTTKAHLEQEFEKGRIKSAEYAQVYLGSVQAVMGTALQFLMNQTATNQDAVLKEKNLELLEEQRLTAVAQRAQVEKQTAVLNQQLLNLQDELLTATAQRARLTQETANLASQKLQIEAETARVGAQTAQVEQQTANLEAEALNIPKQGVLMDRQAAQVLQQTTNLVAEALNIPKQGAVLDAQAAQVSQQTTNLVAQKLQIEQQTSNLVRQNEQMVLDKALTVVKTTNAETEGTVLVAQECKLRAEYDVLMLTKGKTTAETDLLAQKIVTERAQVSAVAVDADSVVGRQKALYVAQTNGFTRDAEQKAAKLMVDSWNVRRTTDEGTQANATNKLDDASVGRAVNKLLEGVGA